MYRRVCSSSATLSQLHSGGCDSCCWYARLRGTDTIGRIKAWDGKQVVTRVKTGDGFEIALQKLAHRAASPNNALNFHQSRIVPGRVGCGPRNAHGISRCGPQQFWNDMAHDSETNAASKMACNGRIRQQLNFGCGNSQETRRLVMSRGCAPAEGIPTQLEREPERGERGLDPRRDAVRSQPIKVTLLTQRQVPSGERLVRGRRG